MSSSEYQPILVAGSSQNNTSNLSNSEINKILLIEDNAADARMVELLLVESGMKHCELVVKKSLNAGLISLEEQDDYAAILLDLSLPDSFGFDTLNTVLQQFPNNNVIVLTGQQDRQLGLKALKMGAQDFLIKGNYDANVFLKTIRFSIERKKYLKKIEEAQTRYQNIFTNSKDAIYVCNSEGKLVDFNKSTSVITGYDNSELFGIPIEALFENRNFWDTFQERVFQSKFVVEEEVNIVCKDESIRNCIISAGQLVYGNFVGINGFIRDITERKQAEKLRQDRKIADQTSKLKEQFIASVSHEMRTPMNAILGMSNLVLKTDLDDEQYNYIKNVKNSSEILLGIVNDILEVSSIQAGKVKFTYANFDFHSLMANMINVMQYKVDEKELNLELKIDPSIPRYLEGDQLRLNQILYNLVGNAIKFTDEGEVCITVKLLNESHGSWHVQFEVTDTGIGIPDDKIGVIFETFTRIRSKDRIFEGTGLGLSIAKNLVEYQGGKIWVESEHNVGSTFSFDLIFEEGYEPKLDAPKEDDFDPETTFNLLLCEDHMINRIVATKTLLKQFPNINLVVAENGKLGVEKLKEGDFDIILMDIQMPVMDGYEATQYIRSEMEPEKAQLPILAMTAHANIAEDDKFKEYGMDDYVLKPFKPEQLFSKIGHYVTLKRNKKHRTSS